MLQNQNMQHLCINFVNLLPVLIKTDIIRYKVKKITRVKNKKRTEIRRDTYDYYNENIIDLNQK